MVPKISAFKIWVILGHFFSEIRHFEFSVSNEIVIT